MEKSLALVILGELFFTHQTTNYGNFVAFIIKLRWNNLKWHFRNLHFSGGACPQTQVVWSTLGASNFGAVRTPSKLSRYASERQRHVFIIKFLKESLKYEDINGDGNEKEQ